MLSDMLDDVVGATLAEVSVAIRRRDVSSVEVTRACLERIEQQQPSLNCFVSVDAGGALNAAARPFDETTLLDLGRAFQSRTEWHRRRPPEPVEEAA